MSQAESTMAELNPNAAAFEESGLDVFLEDVTDPDGRMYRMEYVSTPDGKHAVAFCRFNPWSPDGPPNAGAGYATAHVDEDGFLCLGNGHTKNVKRSPFQLQKTIERARYWCTAFSVYKESGSFPNP